MSHDHADSALLLEHIPPAAKSVLAHVAQTACKYCGLAWPGVSWLEAKTGLGRTAIKAGLEALVRDGHLTVFAYPHGGRGRATEYVVLPQLFPELSTPRCGECVRKQERGRHAAGIVEAKEAATRPVLTKPVAQGGLKGSGGDHQSVTESNQSATLRVGPPVENSPAARPTSDPPPLSRAENAARARALANALSLNLSAETPPAPKGDQSSAATAPLREEAQDRDRPEAD